MSSGLNGYKWKCKLRFMDEISFLNFHNKLIGWGLGTERALDSGGMGGDWVQWLYVYM